MRALWQWLRNQIETKHYMMAQVYGSHLPMQIRMELDILSNMQRLPGLPNSNIGLETILGRDETIDFEDYLGGARRPSRPRHEACPPIPPQRWPGLTTARARRADRSFDARAASRHARRA